MTEECSNCKYFKKNKCRKKPPKIVGSGQYGTITAFPEVKSTDWCGEHESKDKDLYEIK